MSVSRAVSASVRTFKSPPTMTGHDCSTRISRTAAGYNYVFIRLAVVASQICEIPRNSTKFEFTAVHGHPSSLILVSIESTYVM